MAASSSSVTRSLFSVQSSDDVLLQCELWTSPQTSDPQCASRPLILFVHQYTMMGGSRELMAGMARIAAAAGYEAVTFDLRGAGGSSGKCTIRNQSERDDVLAVIRHLEKASPRHMFLVGSSAGASLAGSVLDTSPRVLGGLFVGYTWGWCASLLFGWAFPDIERSHKPKLFVVGTADEFTSMAQYSARLATLAGPVNRLIVIEGKNHFQIEAPVYDQFVMKHAIDFLDTSVDLTELAPKGEGMEQESCRE